MFNVDNIKYEISPKQFHSFHSRKSGQTDRQTLTPHYALIILKLDNSCVHTGARKKPYFHKLWNQKQATFTYKNKSEEFVNRLQNDSPN